MHTKRRDSVNSSNQTKDSGNNMSRCENILPIETTNLNSLNIQSKQILLRKTKIEIEQKEQGTAAPVFNESMSSIYSKPNEQLFFLSQSPRKNQKQDVGDHH